MSAGHMQGAAIAAGTLAAAPALAFVGTTAATVVADAAAGTWMGAIAVNGPAIVASTEIVAGTAAAIATGGGAPTPASMTAAQASNVNRFASKLPKGNSGVAVDALGDGIVATARVPGTVPGSSAVYQKTIDASDQTSSYLKTTFDPRGNVVHIKDKMGGGNIDP